MCTASRESVVGKRRNEPGKDNQKFACFDLKETGFVLISERHG